MARSRTATALAAALVAGLPLVAGPAGASGQAGRPVPVPAAAPAALAGRAAPHIVVLADGAVAQGDVAAVAADQARRYGGTPPGRVFRSALRGYTTDLTPAEARDLAADPAVASVERDGVVVALGEQADAPWGLDRIDQRELPLSGTYTWERDGAGVTGYVVDSGVRPTHEDFGDRARPGFDAVDGGTADDCNGHGTHVASTLGGTTYGVAKAATPVPVRVLSCSGSGSTSGVVAGLDWVAQDHEAGTPAVANMSLGGPASAALDAAVAAVVADGVTVVVAAGNDSGDACGGSPGRAPEAVTVAASDVEDALASFSDGGVCVDLVAPGVDVPGAWHTSDTATATLSGTSMAAPHVAGAVARLLEETPEATPDALASALVETATPDRLSGTGPRCRLFFCRPETPDLLLFSDR